VTNADLVQQVEQVCVDVARAGQQVTFATIAARAGLSRSTLYRHPELRALIDEHRLRGREALTLTGLAVQIDQLRQGLEAVAARTRHHEELLRRLTRRSTRSASA
jgi:AcrR family transcriptional regulator